MSVNWKNRLFLIGGVAVLAMALLTATQSQPARAERGDTPVGGSRYSVILTEGHNLLVTDNGANKIYFYTKDFDKPMGSPLILRADLDLTQVGKPEIRITPHNLEKFIPPEEKK